MVEGPSSGLKSPSQKIVLNRKGKKRSRNLFVIPESVLAEAGTTVLSFVFETIEEEQEEEDEPRLRPHSSETRRN